MQKRKAERERLVINAQAQAVLIQAAITNKVMDKRAITGQSVNDVYEPAGEIDYTKYNKAKS